MSSGGGGGQAAVVTGPTRAAASEAAYAQVQAAQIAAQAATQNTQAAIQALMGEYTTSMDIQQPIINYGNQAAGQLNYMLGLPAAPLPTAPTAPVAPTLASAEKQVSQEQINQYLLENTMPWSSGSGNGYVYYGAGSAQLESSMNNPSGVTGVNNGMSGGGAYMGTNPMGILANNADSPLDNSVRQSIATDTLLPELQQQYATQQQEYQQQQQVYNNELPIAQYYQNLGQATPANITDVVQNLPGYQFQFGQGVQGIQNAASASGMLNSGALLQQLDQFGQGQASTYYNNYLSQLQGLAGLGANASNQSAAQANQVGQSAASAQMNLGNTIANSYLAAGQAEASAYLSPAANQQIISQNVGGSSGGGLGAAGGILSGLGSLVGAFSNSQLKDKVDKVKTEDILESVNKLSLDKWKYKGINREHIGPYAEEFKELFGVGDGVTINLIDAIGVLFGTVKQLSKELSELKRVK